MFNYEYPPLGGGGGVVHALIAEELAKQHRVCVITSGAKDLPPWEERGGVEIFRVPVPGRSALAAASLVSLFRHRQLSFCDPNRIRLAPGSEDRQDPACAVHSWRRYLRSVQAIVPPPQRCAP
jgi:hypothetical protein